jgi:ferredoxin
VAVRERGEQRVDLVAEGLLRASENPVVLLSAGVGATPVLAMLHALVRDRTDRAVWWLHGARNPDEHAFAAEADELLAELPASHRIVVYSQPGGRHIDGAALDAAGVPVDGDYYVCGPAGFMASIGAALTARGVDPSRVSTETFGAVAVYRSGIVGGGDRAPHQPDGAAGPGPAVTFSRSGLTVAWDDKYGSLLDFAEACDVPVGFGCRQGVCHNCESGLLAGDVHYDIEPLEPAPEGRILACCTRPAGELTLDL